MSRLSLLKSAYLSFLSKPVHERFLYRLIHKLRPTSILELGVGTAIRSQRMIQVASRFATTEKVSYVGIDLFEAREDAASGLALKDAHCLLKTSGARIRLIPGDPLSALSRSANSLQSTDLVLIGGDQDTRSLEQSWFYVPRMLHENSLVVVEDLSEGEPSMRLLSHDVIDQLAGGNASGCRAA